ncbi:MAG TPA: lipoyl domain-containing protein [Gemmata sp.]
MSEPGPVSILLPNLGTPRAVFSLWHVRVGERVTEGDRIAEVLIPGATFDVPAPASGRLTEQHVLPNDPLAPGAVLGSIAGE